MNTLLLGFYKMHPCIDDSWRSPYVGRKLFRPLAGDEKRYYMIAFQALDESFDTGSLIGTSKKLALPKQASAAGMPKISPDSAAQLTSAEMKKIIAHHQALL